MFIFKPHYIDFKEENITQKFVKYSFYWIIDTAFHFFQTHLYYATTSRKKVDIPTL